MPLQPPRLDDRSFAELVSEARRRIQQSCPEWTDLTPGDPGMVLLEVFAFLTQTMLYRLNRLPENAYIAFLRLLGVTLAPPAAASVMLRFERGNSTGELTIPGGTRVTTARSDSKGLPPVFVTARAARMATDVTSVEVLAYHCQVIEAEHAGTGSGLAGQSITVSHPPIIAPTGDERDLVVAVETTPDEPDDPGNMIEYGGKVFRVWHEVDNFSNLPPQDTAYVVDRLSGLVTFAPAARLSRPEGGLEPMPQALAASPAAGREIRLWYRRGGGVWGNVAANTLTVIKDSLAQVNVTNPSAATGGQGAESLENALVRGPQELHSLQRAVTAQDYELLAKNSSRAVARAKALTRASVWSYAEPGAVEVLIVPQLSGGWQEATEERLQAQQTEQTCRQIQAALDQRRPLGTSCRVNWARYKTVRVRARVVVSQHLAQLAVRERVADRLRQAINPLPNAKNPHGWRFGQTLRASHVYDIALAEPGVLWVDQLRLLVDDVPNEGVTSIDADDFQPHTWYAASNTTIFRSHDDGTSWVAIDRSPQARAELVRSHPARAGMVASVMSTGDHTGSLLRVSRDMGESWEAQYSTAFGVNDLAWTERNGLPVLLLATDAGLYELDVRPGGSPVQVLVDAAHQDLGFYAVAASWNLQGEVSVAAAARETRGVFLSSDAGKNGTFRAIGLLGEDIRVLVVHRDGPRHFLWAGAAAQGGDAGKGCFRWELRGSEDPPEGWRSFGTGWEGGSCRAIAFAGDSVLAATFRAGVVRLDLSSSQPAWRKPDVRCGLPLRDRGRFHPVDSVASDPSGEVILAGGIEGVWSSHDGGERYWPASVQEFDERVTLPPTWLFCSGEHEITVVAQDEAE